ncbi:hypothetical protein ASG92_15520 [Arthrobacter sp. Soil736]|uniref:hypothetical protein n=1 Tax=Arthrobacter sp. Soil736 TaxID=1736395 RepID=UPI0006F6C290|nr:hypothetical protein [Arthrobacter sp. Soil736]KRE66723.1 hypothetical protein ASG92_15520 [Arthrobacter sp. Soil736]
MAKDLSQQPGNSWRYLYERLTEKRFQQLCSALLSIHYPKVQCFPVGQSDGGRDGVAGKGQDRIIFQVKWSSKRVQDPVSWLTKAIEGEKENIERLVQEGASEYILMTCVAGTSSLGRGSMDRINQEILKYSKAFGIQMDVWWQADLDARVDSAPELKWTYSEMLAGTDAVQALILGKADDEHEKALHDLLASVIATQWVEDSKVKFKQAELDSLELVDLFVDVEAQRISEPRAALSIVARNRTLAADVLGGAVDYLLGSSRPLTLVRGEPGQGKSTLGQYICQTHRAEYLVASDFLGGRPPTHKPAQSRLPLRADLHEYANWITGGDPYDDQQRNRKQKPTLRRGNRSVEAFLADLLSARSGGRTVTVDTVSDILKRFPMLIVLDGLDEVAQDDVRHAIVGEIDHFAARLGTGTTPPQLIVTTRPNASSLPEPTTDRFEVIALSALSPDLRIAYLRKWATAQSVRGANRRALERTFRERTMEPHIGQLAKNPMQLTILLYLMHKRGDSIPTGRTELYSSYMETFLDRESSKSVQVHEHRDDLEEVTAHLGWLFQTKAELEGAQHALAVKSIKKAILNYLFNVDKDTSLVDDLFRAATDRVWALSSKVQGTFAFDVQSVSEYFAAKYLYEFAGASNRQFDPATVLQQLVRRPYWREVSRFYAGFAKVKDLAAHLDALEEEWESGSHPAQTRMTAWALVGDGVFAARPRSQSQATRLFTDDLSIRLLAHFAADDPTFTILPHDRGGAAYLEHLREALQSDPTSPIAPELAALAAKHLPASHALDRWWLGWMMASLGTPRALSWLDIGGPLRAGSRLPAHVTEQILASSKASPLKALNAGLSPEQESDGEHQLLRQVLDGLGSDAEPTGSGYAADLVRILAPQHFLRRVACRDEAYAHPTEHPDEPLSDSRRQAALKRLHTRDSRFAKLQRAMRAGKGQSGTTSIWADTARAIADIFGPCWLATEIALIGAAASEETWTTAATLTKAGQPFGPHMDYGHLQYQVRLKRSRTDWWLTQHDAHSDDLSRATWVLAALTVASPEVLQELLHRVEQIVASLPEPMTRALLLSSSRIGAAAIGRPLPASFVSSTSHMTPQLAALLLHHCVEDEDDRSESALTDSQLHRIAELGPPAWPAHQKITRRLRLAPRPALWAALQACGPNAAVEVLGPLPALDHSQLSAILGSPRDYPRAWVLAAGRELSQRSKELSLSDTAAAGEWFE